MADPALIDNRGVAGGPAQAVVIMNQTMPAGGLPADAAKATKQDTGNTSLALIIPAANAAAITPNDGADLAANTRGLYVGVSGNVKVDMVTGGSAITFVGLAAGIIHPLQVKRVYATGTTATSILGVY